jgi:hypothetical protein
MSDLIQCSTSNCDNVATVNTGPMLVCGPCHHGMIFAEQPVTMDEAARAEARALVKDWCAPVAPNGWEMRDPGYLVGVGEAFARAEFAYWVDARDGYLRTGGGRVHVEVVDVAMRSVIAGKAPSLAMSLTAALDDGDCLRGVIARAIDVSGNGEADDPEEAIQAMLAILMEPEPKGGDDRWDELLELRTGLAKIRTALGLIDDCPLSSVLSTIADAATDLAARAGLEPTQVGLADAVDAVLALDARGKEPTS